MNYHKHLCVETDIIKNIYANPYYWNNPDYFIRLRSIVKTYRTTYARVLKYSTKDIECWISNMLPILSDPIYKISTKVFWILSGMTSFNKCMAKNCQSDIGINQNVNISRGYCNFCSLKCSQPDIRTREKVKKSIQTKLESDPDFFKKAENKKRATRLAHGKSATWNNREKAYKTCIDIYGTKYPMQNKNIAEKTEKTKEFLYGDKFYTNRNLYIKTMLDRYGIEWPMQNKDMVKRGIQSKLEKYGTTTIAGRYKYDNEIFDSKPELAFYVWLKDSNIKFKYHPRITIEFLYKNEKHLYFPDFEINGTYIEIKGDQFFREDGTMFCPYRNKYWTNDKYAYMCELYEAKHQCMLANNIIILKSKDYKKYIKYVNEKYGHKFFSQYKKNH